MNHNHESHPASAEEHEANGRWNQFVGKAQETYGDLTDDWSDKFKGNIRQAMGWLEEKYGDTQERLAEYMDDEDETEVRKAA